MSIKTRKKKNISKKDCCQLCGKEEFLEIHHIRGRKIVKPNSDSNLIDICACCHTSIHMGEFIIEGWIFTTEGKILMWHKKGEPSFTSDDAIPHQIRSKNHSS